ncbi:site-specific integrase [Thiococcus pfennigii]|uniref:site-specific integrase n=1 Tax=Thiococcus pfennigii TaxID=1057 RepID=UPI001903F773|nr:site-specific integrase [Thiococcus pfennigii]MBK1701387.1 hypothetical protein [Thiococcus pfennigii]
MSTASEAIQDKQAYRQWVKGFVLFHGKRHPNEMGEAEIVASLSHLAVQRNVVASTQNQALDALVGPGATPRAAGADRRAIGWKRRRDRGGLCDRRLR